MVQMYGLWVLRNHLICTSICGKILGLQWVTAQVKIPSGFISGFIDPHTFRAVGSRMAGYYGGFPSFGVPSMGRPSFGFPSFGAWPGQPAMNPMMTNSIYASMPSVPAAAAPKVCVLRPCIAAVGLQFCTCDSL